MQQVGCRRLAGADEERLEDAIYWLQRAADDGRDAVRDSALSGPETRMLGPIWVTDDGREIRLNDMRSAHLRAVVAYLLAGYGDRGPMLRAECSGFTNAQWVLLCQAELARRARLG